MVKIRMSGVGRHHTPLFRVVAADSRSPRDGKALEVIGTYNPRAKSFDEKFSIKIDRLKHWLSVGAQPSDRVWNMLRKKGINKANWTAAAESAPVQASKPEPEAAPPASEPAAQ